MATKIQQVAALVDALGMNKLELECVKSLVGQKVEALPSTTECHLLDLPAELRNHIYYYVAILHIRGYGNIRGCGIVEANKQLHSEFVDLVYSKKVTKTVQVCSRMYDQSAKPLHDLVWKVIDSRKLVKVVLDCRDHVRLYRALLEHQAMEWVGNYLNREATRRIISSRLQAPQAVIEPLVYGIIELAEKEDARFVRFTIEKKVLTEYGLGEEHDVLDSGVTILDGG